jgi:D-alanine-D-alanine ligase
MHDQRRIVVMSGGPSAEREVSLRSGAAIARALRSLGHEVVDVDPEPGRWTLPDGTAAVFLALHGTYGEDGTIQAELDRLRVPYTGCGAESSRIAFDKARTKAACIRCGVPVARSRVFSESDAAWPPGWEPPVVLKPLRQGSSVGLQFVDRMDDFSRALGESLRHDTEVMMEERIPGRETTVGILGEWALPVVEVRPREGAYDYANKYTPGRTEYLCPAPFDAAVTAGIQSAALAAFRAVGARDYARVDIMVRHDGAPVVLEVNTLPGMTETSLLPKAAAAAGMDFEELCRRMLDLALQRLPH